MELLVTTLFQAYAVFYLPPEGGPRPGEGALSCGMLFSILENVTSTTAAGKQLRCEESEAQISTDKETVRRSVPSVSSAKDRRVLQEESSTGSWFRYLPPSITEFQPALRTLAQPIQRGQLRDTLQQWIDT